MKINYEIENRRVVKRNFSLDVIRALAVVLVLIIHAFSFDANKGASFLQASILCFAKMAVPLFVLLTGYLNHRKTIDDYYVKGKWKGCFRILAAYGVLGSLCYIGSLAFGHEGNAIDYVKKMLAFKLTPYGWYVEMWVGLFFLTPFLNVTFSFLDKSARKILILTLLILSSAASFLNRNGNIVIPAFWMSLWPMALYFIGAFLSEYRLKIDCRLLMLVLLSVAFGEPLLNFVLHSTPYLYFWGGQDGAIYLLSASCAFIFILNRCQTVPGNRFVSGG